MKKLVFALIFVLLVLFRGVRADANPMFDRMNDVVQITFISSSAKTFSFPKPSTILVKTCVADRTRVCVYQIVPRRKGRGTMEVKIHEYPLGQDLYPVYIVHRAS